MGEGLIAEGAGGIGEGLVFQYKRAEIRGTAFTAANNIK